NVILTGQVSGTVDFGGTPVVTAGGGDAFVAKYSPTGAYIWARVYGDANPQSGTSVAVDTSGNIALAGYFSGALNLGNASFASTGDPDIFVAKLGADGTSIWSKSYGDSATQSPLHAYAVSMDGAGNLLLGGSVLADISFDWLSLPATSSEDA